MIILLPVLKVNSTLWKSITYNKFILGNQILLGQFNFIKVNSKLYTGQNNFEKVNETSLKTNKLYFSIKLY